MHVLTFVTPKPQKDFDLWIKKSHPDIPIEDREVIDDRAVNWFVQEALPKDGCDAIRQEFRVDVFQQKMDQREKKLFLADMDSTIVAGETLDDMAFKAGLGDKIAAITDRAMRGELDFEQALKTRVGMLAGLSTDIIEETLNELIINSGADQLLTHLKSKEVYCVLISGGFTQFTSVVADRLGFDAHFGNELIIEDSVLTGNVKLPILDKNFKRQKLDDLAKQMDLRPHETMAIGDGANDLPMLKAAGFGVGYYPKPLLKDTLINRIEHTDLSSLIYVTK
jgi:phosphoserine phosphatase